MILRHVHTVYECADQEGVEVIKVKLAEDNILSERTLLEHDDIILLLGLCLNWAYFLFQGKYYLQIHGTAVGSPLSLIVCNMYMESFEQKALATAPHRPRWWCHKSSLTT